jgi:hypothetical protein
MSLLAVENRITVKGLNKAGYMKDEHLSENYIFNDTYVKRFRCLNSNNEADFGLRAAILIVKHNDCYQLRIEYGSLFGKAAVYADIDDESDLTFAEMSVKNDFIDTIYKTHKEWLIGVGASKQVIDGLTKESMSEHIKFELI